MKYTVQSMDPVTISYGQREHHPPKSNDKQPVDGLRNCSSCMNTIAASTKATQNYVVFIRKPRCPKLL